MALSAGASANITGLKHAYSSAADNTTSTLQLGGKYPKERFTLITGTEQHKKC